MNVNSLKYSISTRNENDVEDGESISPKCLQYISYISNGRSFQLYQLSRNAKFSVSLFNTSTGIRTVPQTANIHRDPAPLSRVTRSQKRLAKLFNMSHIWRSFIK